MKKLLVVALVFGVCGLVSAADFTVNPNPKPATGGTHVPRLPNITQNLDPVTITAGNSVSCNAGGLHSDNSYWRRFLLATDHGIALQYNVTSVDFGIEQATGAAGSQPVTVNLHSIANGASFLLANLTSLGSAPISVSDQAMAGAANAIRANNAAGAAGYFLPEMGKAIEHTIESLGDEGRLTLGNILSGSQRSGSCTETCTYTNKAYFSLGGYDVPLKFIVKKQADGNWLITNL